MRSGHCCRKPQGELFRNVGGVKSEVTRKDGQFQ